MIFIGLFMWVIMNGKMLSFFWFLKWVWIFIKMVWDGELLWIMEVLLWKWFWLSCSLCCVLIVDCWVDCVYLVRLWFFMIVLFLNFLCIWLIVCLVLVSWFWWFLKSFVVCVLLLFWRLFILMLSNWYEVLFVFGLSSLWICLKSLDVKLVGVWSVIFWVKSWNLVVFNFSVSVFLIFFVFLVCLDRCL